MGQINQTDGKEAPYIAFMLKRNNANLYLLRDAGIAYQFSRSHYPEGYRELMAERIHHHDKMEKMEEMRNNVRLETFRMDMKLVEANPKAEIIAEGKCNDYFMYYTHDALNVHHYQKITYKDVYPRIDWVIYTTDEGGIKYDFIVHAGADPSQIKIQFKHHEELYVDEDGNLIHGNRMGQFTEKKPVSYQNNKPIDTRYILNGDVLSYAIDSYDKSELLVIDPSRLWATYYGGDEWDSGLSCATNGSGNVYLAGWTFSTSGIASGGHQNNYGGDGDAFLVKFCGVIPTVSGESNATVCVNTPVTITLTTTGATGIGTPDGLPKGATVTWYDNTITISGVPTIVGIFNYSIPLTGGCGDVSATGAITVEACTGIEEVVEATFKAYPNPSTGQFTIQSEKGGEFELLDINGKIVNIYSVSSTTHTITENLPAGVYFIREKDTGIVQKINIQ